MSKEEKKLNIIKRKSWSSDEWLKFFQERFEKMKQARHKFDIIWDNLDRSSTQVSFYNNYWELEVIIPLEKVLQEIYIWRTRWRINFDIRPDWQASVDELQPAKYALKFFLDWNEDQNFWEENKIMKSYKAHYWTWIFYTWIRNKKSYKYKEKETVEPNTNILDKNNFEEYIDEKRYFFPKAIHPKNFWIDEAAYWQDRVQLAHDCIYKEKIKLIDLELMFDWNKYINKEILNQITSEIDQNPENIEKSENISEDECILYHYFNKVTKTYLIVANWDKLLYEWYYFYEDWKLPFESIQHYSDKNSFWWEWITARVAYLKSAKSEIFQNILNWAAMAAWVNLLIWNDDEIAQSWEVWWNKVNLWRTTWGAEKIQQINTNINLWFFQNVLALIDQETAMVTWINPAEQISASSEILWIVEINEANKAVRSWSVDESYDIWLDNTLTMTLSRIKQFAPHLLSEKIYDSNWKIIKTIFPKIEIQNMKVEKGKNWKMVFTEDLWKYWYFELKPWVVEGLWVKVVTASTNSVLPIIERKKVSEYIWVIQELAWIAQLDATWESMEKFKKFIRFDRLLEWINDSYEIDQVDLKVNTEKDEIRYKNEEMMEQLQQLLQFNQNPDEQMVQNTPRVPTWEVSEEDEIDRTLQAGDRWLETNPEEEAIISWADPNWSWFAKKGKLPA